MNIDLEESLNKAYLNFVDLAMSNGDTNHLDDFSTEDIMGFGTTLDEVIHDRDELKQLARQQRQQSSGSELNYTLTPVFRKMLSGGNSALIVDEIRVSMTMEGNPVVLNLRFSLIMEKIDGRWKAVHWHGSKPEYNSGGSDTWHKEEWKRKNEELEQMVALKTADLENKNHELEIETALERVRAMAMSMQKPDDLAEVCQAISEQLEVLNVKNIRNVQLAIINEEKKNYANYQYFTAYSKQVFEEPLYGTNPSADGMVRAMQESANSFFVGKIQGEELREFIEWRKKDNQFPDPLLEKAGVAYYYFYSIGKGGLGLTTYKEISEESVEVFKRFHKVFTLAYQRFIDIRQALEQAREAQVEAALERVRAASLAMHKTDELKLVIETVFSQLRELKLPLNACYIDIFEEDNYDLHIWVGTGMETYPDQLTLPYLDHPLFKHTKKARLKGESFFTIKDSKKSKDRFVRHLAANYNVAQERIDLMLASDGVDMSVALSENIALNVYNYQGIKFSEEENQIIRRFSSVFQQAYTRFLDLQKAEAQARESQIQLALERVRARTMAMQSSEELAEVSYLLNKQVVELGIPTRGCAFNIYNEHDSTEWFSSLEGTVPNYRTPRENFFLKYYEAGKRGETLIVEEYGGERIKKHYKYLATLSTTENSEETIEEDVQVVPEFQIDHVAYFKYGYVLFITLVPAPEAHDIFKRFAKEFEQTYTRFLDLEKAEIQAREARIEASLEKVRGVALSLQKSDQMLQIAQVLYEQLLELGFNNIRNAIIDIKNGNTDTFTDYDYSHEMSGTITQMSYHDDPTLTGQFKKMASTTNDFFELILEGKELEDLKKMRKANGEAPDPRLDKIDLLTYNLYSFGNGAIGISNFGVLTEEEKSVLARFSNVFTFAYKRYTDMVQAEAQAREALVELSLERIRAQVTAMQQSSELLDIVVTMQTEFNKLGHEAHYFWHMRWLPDKYEKALTNAEGDRIGNVLELPRGFHGLKNMMDWEQSDEPSAVFALEPDIAANYIDKMITLGRFQEIDHTAPGPDEVREMGGLTFVMARTTHGEIGYTLPGEVPNPPKDDIALLVRFAGVFDLAYRRFEDLKKAEQQHRETQIDLALERVRAKTMAMQKNEELSEVVANLFYQLEDLGIKTYRCNLGIIDGKTKQCRLWSTTSDGKVIPFAPNIPLTENKHLKKIYTGWEKQGAPVIDIIKGKARLEWSLYISNFSDFEEYRPEKLDKAKIISEPAILNHIFFGQGFFTIHTVEELEKATFGILQRFANVFEQTYTRFLDLQRAELQAREAVKQAALDRIRGQIASMRTTEDLQQLTPLVWQELKTLEVPFFRCGLFIVNEIRKHVNVYLTTPDGKPLGVLDLDFNANDLARATVASWKKKEVYQTHWNRQEFIAWTKEMMQLGQVKVPEKYQGAEKPPESLYLHFIPFAQGMLYVGHEHQLDQEKIDLVKSLAEAFSFAYARYEDFVVLEEAKERVEKALRELKSTQSQLVHAEKMASLGELTAGIAHEIQNPLNFVNNFSEVSTDLIEELKDELQNGDTEEVNAIATDLLQNLEKITHHGRRASNIVKSMLEHSRAGTGEKQPADINALADEYLRLAYHGLRAKDKSFNADFKMEPDKSLPMVNVVAQDIGRVLLNLINNAFYAVNEKARQNIEGYKPVVVVSTKLSENKIEISVVDNGNGIQEEVKKKIFQPFFTTKPTGQGTGLGLSMSYDIITKGHDGDLTMESMEGEGSKFTIILNANA